MKGVFAVLRSTLKARGPAPRRFVTGIVVLTLLLLGGGGTLARLQATLDAPSPATGGASVVANGVAAMPFDPIAWRVVADTADPLAGGQPVERALGFVVAEPDGVHVINSDTGSQIRLAPGEASFVAEGAIEQRASLGDQPGSYLRVALVGAGEAQDPGNDTLVFGGAPFVAPAGLRDIDLVREVLSADATGSVSSSDYPVLIIATAGSLEITSGDQTVTLNDGEAAEFSGEITIAAGADGGTYLAGVIGPEVPAVTRDTGTFSLGIIVCAPGITETAFGDPYDPELAAQCTADATGVVTELIAPDGTRLALSDAEEVRPGVFAWTDLPFGVYGIASPTALPETVVDRAVYDADGSLVAGAEAEITETDPDAHLDLFLFQGQAGEGGSVSVTVYNCPNGMAPDTLDPSACSIATDGFDISLTNAETGDLLGLEDATVQGSSFIWTDLPVGTDYYIDQSLMPSGFSFWLADGASVPDGEGGFYYVSLSSDAPDASVAIYNLAEAAGTITLDTVVCPSADSAPGDCVREFGPTGLGGVYLLSEDGSVELTAANASQEGDGPYVWPNITLGYYVMDTTGLVAPEGYQVSSVVLTPDGVDASAGITISDDLPIANIVVILVPVQQPSSAAIDTDSDGLSDSDEAVAGTDASDSDSDDDCYSDGAEVVAGTDPLDSSSTGSGDCDVTTG